MATHRLLAVQVAEAAHVPHIPGSDPRLRECVELLGGQYVGSPKTRIPASPTSRGSALLDDLDYTQDRRLVERARDGDQAAAQQIVERHQDRVYRLAYRLTGDVEAAHDIAQDVFLRTLQSLGRIHDPQALTRWLTRTTTNLAHDRWRGRRDTVEFNEDVYHAPTPQRGPSEQTASVELGERIQQALMELPHGYREAFVLRHVEQMSHEEMCDELDIGLSAVKVRIHRACRMLRKLLPEYEDE